MMPVSLFELEMYWSAFLSMDYPVRLILSFLNFLFSSTSKQSSIFVFGWFSGYFSSSPVVGWEIPDAFCFH